MATEKLLVHDWSSGLLEVYEIEAEIIEAGEPPEENTDGNE
jgi:hypothetical protein